VDRSNRLALLYTTVVVAVWAIGLPGALILDEIGSFDPPWRGWGLGVGGVLVAIGALLSFAAGRHLARAGSGLFGVRPTAVLVTDGLYRVVRNPQDVGATLVALGPPIAVELPVLWMVPVIGFVYFALGIGLLEDRHLLETFETEFRSYRAAVAKWFPIR
jgi:protein-S-isoprenylcysteine O-methyltransferase Ste14